MPIAGGQCAFINFFLVGACAARSSAPAQRGWSKRSEVGGCAARLEDAQRGWRMRSEVGAGGASLEHAQRGSIASSKFGACAARLDIFGACAARFMKKTILDFRSDMSDY